MQIKPIKIHIEQSGAMWSIRIRKTSEFDNGQLRDDVVFTSISFPDENSARQAAERYLAENSVSADEVEWVKREDDSE